MQVRLKKILHSLQLTRGSVLRSQNEVQFFHISLSLGGLIQGVADLVQTYRNLLISPSHSPPNLNDVNDQLGDNAGRQIFESQVEEKC
nr:neurobeachin [Hymenolepis microstoma]